MAPIPLHALDHIVLTVRSIPTSVAFYTTHFGMRHERFTSSSSPDIERHSLIFGAGRAQQKINLHEVGKEFLPRATLARPGTADLCFLTRTPVEDVRDRLRGAGVEMETLAPEEGMEGGERGEGKWQGWDGADGRGEDGVTGAVVRRTGARGKLRSVYLRDPDGNLVEVSNYEGEVD